MVGAPAANASDLSAVVKPGQHVEFEVQQADGRLQAVGVCPSDPVRQGLRRQLPTSTSRDHSRECRMRGSGCQQAAQILDESQLDEPAECLRSTAHHFFVSLGRVRFSASLLRPPQVKLIDELPAPPAAPRLRGVVERELRGGRRREVRINASWACHDDSTCRNRRFSITGCYVKPLPQVRSVH